MPYKNPEKQKEAQREWYKKNHNRSKVSLQARRTERRAWLYEQKSKERCKQCGEGDPSCLDYHHRDPANKSFSITEAVKQAFSEERILQEMNKCDVFCANCHMKGHHQQDKTTTSRAILLRNRKWLRDLKTKSRCSKCDKKHSLCFHHRNDEVKLMTIAKMVGAGYSLKRLEEEVAKCDVLCNNCHRQLHNGNKWDCDSLKKAS